MAKKPTAVDTYDIAADMARVVAEDTTTDMLDVFENEVEEYVAGSLEDHEATRHAEADKVMAALGIMALVFVVLHVVELAAITLYFQR